MLSLNLPVFETKIAQREGRTFIFDSIRSKYVALTPEEWVRQHFVNFLLTHKGYPRSLMGNEVLVELNGMKKRCDTAVYNRELAPLLIVEYKAPDVPITQSVFDQICRYNSVLRVQFLIVSNGLSHYCCKIDYTTNRYSFLADIPSYVDLLAATKT